MTNIAKGVVGLDVDREGLKGALGGLEGMFGQFGQSAGATFALGFGAVVAVGGILTKIGADVEEAHRTIQVATGASGANLDALNASFSNVAGSSVSGFKDVASTIGALSSQLGLSGVPLESLTRQVTDLSRITKTDLGTNVSSIADGFKNWGVAAGDQGGKLDELFRVSQKTGTSVGDLASGMTTSGVVMRAAGFNFEQSAALLGLLGQNGLSVATIMPAMSKAMAVAAKEHKPAAQVFQETFDKIKNAPNDVAAAGDALKVFGAKAGPKLAELIREGKLSYEDFAKAIAAGGTTIEGTSKATETWHEKLTALGHGAAIALEPLASKVFGVLSKAVEAVTPYVQQFTKWMGEESPKALAAIQSGWNRFGAPVFAGIKTVIGDVVAWVTAHWPQIQAVFERVQAVLGEAMGKIKSALADVWDAMKSTFGWLMDNKEVLIGAAIGIGAVLVVMFAMWLAGAIAAAAATLAAAAPFIAIGVAIAAVAAGVLYCYNHFTTFHNIVDAVGRFLRDTLWPILKQVFGWLVDNVPPIFDKIVAVLHAMWTGFQYYWNLVVEVVTVEINIIRGIIEAVVATISWIWDHFGQAIVNVVQGMWDAVVLIINGVKDFFVGIFDLIKDLVTGKWGALWGDVEQIVRGVWETIKGVITGAWAIIEGYFTVAWDALKAAWSAVWGAVAGVLSGAWEGIKSAVSGGIDAVVGFVQGLPRRAIDALSSLGGLLFNLGADVFNTMLLGVSNGWDTVWGFIKSLPATVIGAFSHLGSDLYGLMHDAIASLWDAIKSAWNWVVGKTTFTLPQITIPMPPGVADLHIGGGTYTLLPQFAEGGIVGGNGGQLAVVHAGEMYLNAAQQAQLFAIANGAGAKNGISIDTVNVNTGRSLEQELRLLTAVYGRAA